MEHIDRQGHSVNDGRIVTRWWQPVGEHPKGRPLIHGPGLHGGPQNECYMAEAGSARSESPVSLHDDDFKRNRAEPESMVTLYDVPADALIEALAEKLEGELEAPDWAVYAKSGAGREFPPEQADFWVVRAASVLRTVAKNGPVGVKRLATRYGSAKEGSSRYGMAPRHRTTGSRNQLRTILQQLEEAGYLERPPNDEGRVVSAEGQSLLDTTAGEVIEDLDRPELERYA